MLFSITTFLYYKTRSVARSNHIFSLIKIRNTNSRSNVRNNIYIEQLICNTSFVDHIEDTFIEGEKEEAIKKSSDH